MSRLETVSATLRSRDECPERRAIVDSFLLVLCTSPLRIFQGCMGAEREQMTFGLHPSLWLLSGLGRDTFGYFPSATPKPTSKSAKRLTGGPSRGGHRARQAPWRGYRRRRRQPRSRTR